MDPTKARRFYQVVGDEIFFTESTDFFNLGYWGEGAATLDEACADLAILLAKAADFGPGQSVLDAGCGFGDAANLWRERFDLAQVVGVNVTPEQVSRARDTYGDAIEAGYLDFRLGSATQMDFLDATFDRVVALESAFHFVTRRDFFAEAFRVLVPGGRLGTADILPLPPGEGRRRIVRLPQELRRWIQDHAITVYPFENYYDRARYATMLSEIGFAKVSVRSIRTDVYQPLLQWLAEWLPTSKREDLSERTKRTCARLLRRGPIFNYLTSNFDYVVVSATKPKQKAQVL